MSELAIISTNQVVELIHHIRPYLRIKKNTADLVLEIAKRLPTVTNEADFIEVCKLVDKIAEFTDGKRRTISSEVVKLALDARLPVRS